VLEPEVEYSIYLFLRRGTGSHHLRKTYPTLLFSAAPVDINPIIFSFDDMDFRAQLETVANFAFRFQVNRVGFFKYYS
jgi:hypothetical protein